MPKKLTPHFLRNYENPDKLTEIFDTVKTGLSVRITPTGHKTFYFRYSFGGKVKRYKIGKFPTVSLSKARDRVEDLHFEVHQGIDPAEEKKKRQNKRPEKSFQDLAEAFKTVHIPSLRKKTRDEYKRIIDNELIPAFKNIPAKDLTMVDIIDLLDKKAFNKKNPSPVMANRIRARLHTIYEFGIGRDIVKENPVSKVPKYKAVKDDTGDMRDVEQKKDRFYSLDEIRELWKAFNLQDEPAQAVFKMLLICGQRSTETRHMHWDDIHLNYPLQIERERPDGTRIKKTIHLDLWTIPKHLSKSNREHVVPLSPMAMEVLQERKESTGGTGYVFQSIDGKPLQSIKRPKKKVRDISGVDDFTPHDLRRTAATYMAKRNVERTILGKVLNHKGLAGDGQVTAIYDRYDYLEERSTALNKWSRYLTEILESEPGETKIHQIGKETAS